MELTNVYYEKSFEDANNRLASLRKDKHKEIKAYILKMPNGEWRVLRRIDVSTENYDNLSYRLKLIESKVSSRRRRKKGV